MKIGESASFGEVLQTLRKQKKMRQKSLAELLGVHRNTIGAWERGDRLPDTRGIVIELAKQLRLDDPETHLLLETSLTGLSPYWYVPYQRNPFFTGRVEALHTLHQQLYSKQVVALSQSYALSGLGGIGKTQLALEYVYRHANEFYAVFWVAAETKETILSSFTLIAEQLHLPECEGKDLHKLAKAVQHWFTAHKEWLLIFDNVEDVLLLKTFLPPARQGTVLITTRLHMLEGLAHNQELLPFTLEEGEQLLLSHTKHFDSTVPMDNFPAEQLEAAKGLVEAMAGLPLALDQAAAYIESTGCSLADYVQLFQSHPTYLLNERSIAADHPHSVAKTFQISFERLIQQHTATADLLRICAFLSPDAIPEELFTAGAVHVGSRINVIATDPHLWNQTISEALRYSLLQRNSQSRTLSVHRLVQVVLKDIMDLNTQRQWVERVIQGVNNVFPQGKDPATWFLCQRYLPHALECASHMRRYAIISLEGARILQQAGVYLCEQAHYTDAESLLKSAFDFQSYLLDEYDSQRIENLVYIAQVHEEQHNFTEAEQWYQQAILLAEQTLTPDDAELATVLENLGVLCCRQRKYTEAEDYFQRTLAIREQLQHPKLMNIYSNLAALYHGRGQYRQAEQFYLSSLSIAESRSQLNQHSTAFAFSNLANLYITQAEYPQAEALIQRALHIWEQTFEENHPYLLFTRNFLAVTWMYQEKYAQAEAMFSQVLTIQQELTPDSVHLAMTMDNLGIFYLKYGEYAQAEPLFQQALVINQHQLGMEHTFVARTLHNLATLYLTQGLYAQAESFFQKALAIRQRSLGSEHHLTGQTISFLAILYHRQNRDAQANECYQQALAIFEQALSPRHPDRTSLLFEFSHEKVRSASSGTSQEDVNVKIYPECKSQH